MKAFIICDHCGARIRFDAMKTCDPRCLGWNSRFVFPTNGNYTATDGDIYRYEEVFCDKCSKIYMQKKEGN